MKLALAIALLIVSASAVAGKPNSATFLTESVPAVSQPLLIALAFVVGLIGAHLIRKQKTR